MRQSSLVDLGNFGGTCGLPLGLNNRGQVVGLSNLAGDQTATLSCGIEARLAICGRLEEVTERLSFPSADAHCESSTASATAALAKASPAQSMAGPGGR